VHELRLHFKHAGTPGENVDVGHADDGFGAHALDANAGHAIGQRRRFAGEERARRIHAAESALLLDLRVLGMHDRGITGLLQSVQILFQAVIPESGHHDARGFVGARQFARAAEVVDVCAVACFAIAFIERADLHEEEGFGAVFRGCFFAESQIVLDERHYDCVVCIVWIGYQNWMFDMRRLICNEILSLNAFVFVFYHDNRRDFLRLQRLRRLVFDLVLDLVFLTFDLVLLVFLVFNLAPPLGLDSNICIILVDFD